MFRRQLFGILAVSAVACIALAGEPSIEGAWEIVESSFRGKKVGEGFITFTKDKMTLAIGKGEKGRDFDYALDPSKTPKQLHMTAKDEPYAGKKATAIYKFDGDKLVLCIPRRPGDETPTEFTSNEKSQNLVLTLKRKK
jgi:uncharacterized protein (TIGR03067 family)